MCPSITVFLQPQPSYRRAADPEGEGAVFFHSPLAAGIDTPAPTPTMEEDDGSGDDSSDTTTADRDIDPDLCFSGGAFDDDPPPAEGSCDVVLVDAPCSSSGVLRRRPSLRWTLDPPQALGAMPEQQKELLGQAQVCVCMCVCVGWSESKDGWG